MATARRPGSRKTAAKKKPSRTTRTAPGPVVPQPLVAVRDVMASKRWYATLLGLRPDAMPSDHGHLYGRLWSGDRLVLQLHAWDEEDHPNLVHREEARPGHGVLLWFQVEDFDDVVERVAEIGAEVVLPPHVNEAPGHREIWIRDPDGYVVVVASPDGEAD
jgi:catechol 2,3-dioxygenase-like lactoylglutathione lyase family enzyme